MDFRFFVLAANVVIGFACSAAAIVGNMGFEACRDGVPAEWKVSEPAYSLAGGKGMNGSTSLAFEAEEAVTCGEPVSQVISLQSGVIYRLSAWVKTSDIKSTGRGAGVGIEWWNNKGVFSDFRTMPFKGTHDEWTRVSVETPRVPDNLTRIRVVAYGGYGKVSGKAWIDEVIVEPVAVEPVHGLYCDAYRGVFADEPLKVRIALDIPPDVMNAKGAVARLSWKDASGKEHRKSAVALSQSRGDFEFASGELPVGEHLLVCEVRTNGFLAGRSSCRVKRLAKHPARRVRFDRFGRTLVGERPFFPLCVYERTPTVDVMRRLKSAGFNGILDYDQCTKEKMDEYAANGMMVIYGLKDAYFGHQWCPKEIASEADERPYVERHVRAFRDHPALLAWYLNDEMPVDMVPRLAKRRRLFEELDPDHPTYNCLWQVGAVREYMDATDVIGTDPYPVARAPISLAGDWTLETRRNTLGIRPMWQIPQAMSWHWFKSGGPKDRMPTTEELRSMCWQMLACGANGFVFYAHHQMREKSRGDYAHDFGVVATVVGELAKFTDVFLSNPADIGFETGCREDLMPVRLWAGNGAVYALIVNATASERDAKIDFDCAFGRAETVFGQAGAVCSGKRVALKLKPWTQAMVRLNR